MNELQTFYFTFDQNHPLRDCWIEICAHSGKAAREAMVGFFGTKWAFQYKEADFKSESFPGGRAGRSIDIQ